MEVTHLVTLVGGKSGRRNYAVASCGHPAIDAKRGRYISCQIAIVAVKASRFACDESLHLHVAGCHECAGHIAEVDAFITLIHVVSTYSHMAVRRCDASLYFKSCLELRWKLFPALPRPTQDSQAGGLAQIISLGH